MIGNMTVSSDNRVEFLLLTIEKDEDNDIVIEYDDNIDKPEVQQNKEVAHQVKVRNERSQNSNVYLICWYTSRHTITHTSEYGEDISAFATRKNLSSDLMAHQHKHQHN